MVPRTGVLKETNNMLNEKFRRISYGFAIQRLQYVFFRSYFNMILYKS